MAGESDLPGQFDYRCRMSMSGGACTLSVFDQREAEDMCDADPDCQAFIMTKQHTWTGKRNRVFLVGFFCLFVCFFKLFLDVLLSLPDNIHGRVSETVFFKCFSMYFYHDQTTHMDG